METLICKKSKDIYTRLYKRYKHDSPEEARINFVRQLYEVIPMYSITQKPLILDVGAGPQIIERQFFRYIRDKRKPYPYNPQFITMDIADIPSWKLLTNNKKCVSHIQANAQNLAFPDSIFDIVISNLAIDFAGSTALWEVSRVIKPSGFLFITLHHPSLFMDIENKKDYVQNFWLELIKEGYIFSSEEQIIQKLKPLGFELLSISQDATGNGDDKWWTVLCRSSKTNTP